MEEIEFIKTDRQPVFDEMNPIHQPSCTMRLKSIFLAFLAMATSGLAQTTNTSNDVGMDYAAVDTNAAAAVPRTVRELSLQDCIELALRENLDLQIERTKPQVQLYSLRSYYGGYDPTITLSGQHDHSETAATGTSGASTYDDNQVSGGINGLLPWGTAYGVGSSPGAFGGFGPLTDATGRSSAFGTNVFQTNSAPTGGASGSVGVSASQSLLKNFWIDNTRLNIRVAKNRLKYSELGLKWQIIQTATTLEQAYYDLIYDREYVVVQQKAVELAERLVSENKKKLEVGALAPLDLESAEAQAAQNRADLIKARSQLATQERKLKQLLTDKFPTWADIDLVPSGKLTDAHHVFDRQESWKKGLTERPDLLQSRLDVEKQGITLKYDKNQLFPELDVFGSYGYYGDGREYSDVLYQIQQRTQPYYTFGGKLSIPLANTSARNTYKSDKVTLQQLLLTLKKAEQSIMVNIDNDIGSSQSDYEQVLATRAARQYAESALNAEQTKLQNGKSTVYTVLQMQRDLTTARGNEIQALDTYNQSLSTLSQDEGSTLERLGIDVQAK
jgi:outer membrane protein TolC